MCAYYCPLCKGGGERKRAGDFLTPPGGNTLAPWKSAACNAALPVGAALAANLKEPDSRLRGNDESTESALFANINLRIVTVVNAERGASARIVKRGIAIPIKFQPGRYIQRYIRAAGLIPGEGNAADTGSQ